MISIRAQPKGCPIMMSAAADHPARAKQRRGSWIQAGTPPRNFQDGAASYFVCPDLVLRLAGGFSASAPGL